MLRDATTQKKRGVIYALLAYFSWGLLPLYWRLLSGVPPVEVLAHRMVWSCFFLVIAWVWRFQRGFVQQLRPARKSLKFLLWSASLITLNWFVYLYAVTTGRVLESSLGYFIAPVVSIFLGTLILKEKLKPLQTVALALVCVALGMLTVQLGRFPGLSLVIALSFGFYSLVRKKIPLDPFLTSVVESSAQMIPATIFLVGSAPVMGHVEVPQRSFVQMGLLVLSGALTAAPLLWFSRAVQLLPLSTVGFFQYLSPSLQLFLAVVFFSEPFTQVHAQAFFCIWTGLLLYSVDLFKMHRV